MADIQNQIFPGSNRIPFDGGTIKVESGMIDDADDYLLDTLTNVGIWTFTGSTTDVNVLGNGKYKMVSSGASISWRTDMSPLFGNQYSKTFCVGTTHLSDNSSTICKLGVKNTTSGNELILKFEKDKQNNKTIVRVTHQDANNSKTDKKLVELDGAEFSDIRMAYHGSESEFRFGLKTKKDQKKHKFVYAGAFSDGDDYSLYTGVDATGKTVSDWNTHKLFPVIQGFPSNTFSHFPFCRNKNGNGEAFFEFFPAYPGKFQNVDIHGVGNDVGNSESIQTLISTESEIVDDELSFLVTELQDIDTDESTITRCRSFAKEREVQGDFKLHMNCINDGTSNLNSNTPHDNHRVELTNSRKIGTSSVSPIRDFKPPEFLFKDIKGPKDSQRKVYGENFDFQKLHTTKNELINVDNSKSKTVKHLRTEILSNGDRIYYGIVYSPFRSGKDVTVEIEPIGSADWELGYADGENGTVIASGTGVSTKTVITPSDNANLGGLEPGRLYYLSIDKGNGRVYLDSTNTSGKVINSIDDMESSYSDGVGPNNKTYNDGLTEHKMLFEIKQPRGSLVAYHYDVDDNSIFGYYSSTKDVSLRSDSISCVEMNNGNVAIIYEEANQDGFWDIKSKKLAFRELHIDTTGNKGAGFGGVRELKTPFVESSGSQLNINKYIHAFDFVKLDDNTVEFLLATWDSSQSSIISPIVSDTIVSWQSNLDKSGSSFSTFTFQIADGETERVNAEFGTVSRTGLESLKRLYEKGVEVGSIADEHFQTLDDISILATNIYRLEANYDEDRDRTLLSVINYRNRAPILFSGKGGSYKELNVPRFFDAYSKGDRGLTQARNEGTSVPSPLFYQALNSLSATFGSDGMVYAGATRERYSVSSPDYQKRDCELAIIDPQFLFNSYRHFIQFRKSKKVGDELGRHAKYWENNTYKFQTIPFWNNFANDEKVGLDMISLKTHRNYIICTFGDKEKSRDYIWPNIYQSGNNDTKPFDTQLDEVWVSQYKDNSNYNLNYVDTEVTSRSNAIDNSSFYSNLNIGTDLPYGTVYNGYTDSNGDSFRSEIVRTLGSHSGRVDDLSNGYRFSICLSEIIDTGGDYFSYEFVFYAEAYHKVSSGLYDRVRVGLFYNGEEVQARYYDSASDSWKSVGNSCSVSDNVKEFHILLSYDNAEDNQASSYNFAFVVKENDHLDNIKSNTHYHSFKNESDLGVETLLVDEVSGKDLKTNFSCFFDNDSTPYDELVEVHHMGWAPLKIDEGVQTEQLSDGTYSDNTINLPGRSWRKLDDRNVLGNPTNYPYGYRVSLNDFNSKRSSKYHWPNGFEFYFSGSKSEKGDDWVLNRKIIGNAGNLAPSKIHTFYTSKNDESKLRVWGDSNNIGLDEFVVNSLVISRANFSRFNIIATNSTDANGAPNNWKTLKTVVLDKYQIPAYRYSQVVNSDENLVLSVDEANFTSGLLSGGDFYIGNLDDAVFAEKQPESLSQDRAAKVYDSHLDKVSSRLRKTGTNSYASFNTGSNIYIYQNRKFVLFDDIQKYRFFGIEIPKQSLFEDRFEIGSLDFGLTTNIISDYSYNLSSSISYNMEVTTSLSFDEQAVYTNRKKVGKTFEMVLDNIKDSQYDRVKSVIEDIAVSRKVVWVIQNGASFDKFYKCMIDGEISHSTVIDENGDTIHNLSFNLVSIE